MTLLHGTVAYFNDSKGFGYINHDNHDDDLYFYYDNIKGTGYKSLEKGQNVLFELGKNSKGNYATEVKVINNSMAAIWPVVNNKKNEVEKVNVGKDIAELPVESVEKESTKSAETKVIELEFIEDYSYIRGSDGKEILMRNFIDREAKETIYIPRHPSQQGHKYIPPKKGTTLKYIIKIKDGKEIFVEVGFVNPYFIRISDLPKSVKTIFNKYRDIYFVKSNKQQIDKNNFWLLTLGNEIYQALNEAQKAYNLELAKSLGCAQLDLQKHITSSGFLETFDNDKRKEIKDVSNKIISRTKTNISITQIVESDDLKNEIDKLLNVDLTNIVEFSILLGLMEFDDKLISNEQIEKISKIVKDNCKFALVTQFNYCLRDRKKRLRHNLFDKSSYISAPEYKGNIDLKHIIFLEKFELNLLKESNNIQSSILSEADYLRYLAYYHDDSSYAEQAIKLLEQDVESDQLRRESFDRDNLFAKAQTYRYLAKSSISTKETIKYFRLSSKSFAALKSAASFIDDSLLKYYEIVLMFEKEINIQKIIKQAERYSKSLVHIHNNKESEEILIDNIKSIFDALTYIGTKQKNDKEWLLNQSHKPIDSKEFIDDILGTKQLSTLILADILLSDINKAKSKKETTLSFDKYREVIKTGSINLKNSSLTNESSQYNNMSEEESQLIEKLKMPESQALEYKGTYNLNVDRHIAKKDQVISFEPRLSELVVIAIAGMLNSNDGGHIYIGVLEKQTKYKKDSSLKELLDKFSYEELGDDNLCLGIDHELELMIADKSNKVNSLENYIGAIQQQTENQLGKESSSNFNIEALKVFGKKTIIKIIVKPGRMRDGWYLNEIFYLRKNIKNDPQSPKEVALHMLAIERTKKN